MLQYKEVSDIKYHYLYLQKWNFQNDEYRSELQNEITNTKLNQQIYIKKERENDRISKHNNSKRGFQTKFK